MRTKMLGLPLVFLGAALITLTCGIPSNDAYHGWLDGNYKTTLQLMKRHAAYFKNINFNQPQWYNTWNAGASRTEEAWRQDTDLRRTLGMDTMFEANAALEALKTIPVTGDWQQDKELWELTQKELYQTGLYLSRSSIIGVSAEDQLKKSGEHLNNAIVYRSAWGKVHNYIHSLTPPPTTPIPP